MLSRIVSSVITENLNLLFNVHLLKPTKLIEVFLCSASFWEVMDAFTQAVRF